VHLRSDTSSIEAVTDDNGVYEVYGLPPGNYRIVVDLPKGLRVYFPMIGGGEGRRNRLDDLRATEPVVGIGAGTAADVDFALIVDNQMSGRVLDPAGNPMKDVCVQLEPASATAGQHFYVSGCSNDKGRFIMKDMPAGQYRIVTNPERHPPTGREPFSTLYYPGTPYHQKATVLTIGDGEHVDGVDIHVPVLARRIRLSGRAEFSDGVPVARMWVRFIASDRSREEQGADTRNDGSFQLTIAAGVPGKIEGEIMVDRDSAAKCPAFHAEVTGVVALLAPLPIAVAGDADWSGISLTFPFPSCREWRNYALELPSGQTDQKFTAR
jgi:hypothetical protein